MQSGTAYSPWAIELNPVLQARRLARRAGYEGDDLEEVVDYLKSQSAAKLTELADEIQLEDRTINPARCASVKFIPSVERIEEGAFLPDHPDILMLLADSIPAMVGFNSQEGLLYYLAQEHHHMQRVLNDPSMIVEQNFHLKESRKTKLLEKIRKFYFKGEAPTKNHLPEVVKLYSDLYFMKFELAIDHMVCSDIPPFVYLFDYEGHFNLFKKEYFQKYVDVEIKGAAHADEMAYLFYYGLPVHDDDKLFIRRFCTLWTNFAKNGNPTSSLPEINWRTNTEENPCHLRIGGELQVFDERINKAGFKFWRKWVKRFQW